MNKILKIFLAIIAISSYAIVIAWAELYREDSRDEFKFKANKLCSAHGGFEEIIEVEKHGDLVGCKDGTVINPSKKPLIEYSAYIMT